MPLRRDRRCSPRGATLRWTRRPPRRDVGAVVLVLHGGREHGTEATSWRQPAVARMVPFARAVARRGRGGLAVARLRYGARGWNADAGPVQDARWALQRLAEDYPDTPVGLLGYSMGGRVALWLAAEPQVASVVTLAAWVDQRDLTRWRVRPALPVLLLHGLEDRVTSPAGSEAAADRLAELGARVELDLRAGVGHALLRHARGVHRRVAEHLVTTVLTAGPGGRRG